MSVPQVARRSIFVHPFSDMDLIPPLLLNPQEARDQILCDFIDDLGLIFPKARSLLDSEKSVENCASKIRSMLAEKKFPISPADAQREMKNRDPFDTLPPEALLIFGECPHLINHLLMDSCVIGDIKTVQKIVYNKHFSDKQINVASAVIKAARGGFAAVVQVLIKNERNPLTVKDLDLAYQVAAESGPHLPVMDVLIDAEKLALNNAKPVVEDRPIFPNSQTIFEVLSQDS